MSLQRAFNRVRVQLFGIFAIFLITLVTFAVAKPELLQTNEPAWTITGNAVADNALFDKHFTGSKCADIMDEICGTDGKTYRNLCEARNAGVDMHYLGPC